LSTAATVNVWEPPAVPSPATPLRFTITAGDDITLSATATGTLPISYSWRRNLQQFTNMILFSNVSTVFLPNVQPAMPAGVAQTNTYSLRVTNIAAQPGTLSTIALERVLNPPVITNQPVSQTTGLGSNVTFAVEARGGTPQRNQWYKNGAILPNQTNTSLLLNNVQLSSEGTYAVIITNLDGTATSANALLIIDSDKDGIPDSWELAHGLNPNDPTDATRDADGDGMSNRDEYIAGTDPSDPTSYLRVDGSGISRGVVLYFMAITNRAYSIESRTLVNTGTWTKRIDIPANFSSNRLITITNAPFTTDKQIYRLVTQKVQ